MKPKSLLCLFAIDEKILCQHVHETNFGVIHRCLNCKYYTEFCREMEAEEDEFFDEARRMRKLRAERLEIEKIGR